MQWIVLSLFQMRLLLEAYHQYKTGLSTAMQLAQQIRNGSEFSSLRLVRFIIQSICYCLFWCILKDIIVKKLILPLQSA